MISINNKNISSLPSLSNASVGLMGSKWVCGAGICSDNPDPVWEVDEFIAEELISIWDSLLTVADGNKKYNFLGYKGCWLRSEDNEEWFTYKGIVTYKRNGKVYGTRMNEDRSFEKRILSTIPANIEK